MEKADFIAKAKEDGMGDSAINEFLEYYAQLEKEGKAYPLESFFEGVLSADEIDITCAGVPVPVF
jgi:hypothetical protein